MYIRDIQPFTGVGNYQVDIPLGLLSRTINDYIENYGLQLDPDFQRGHVWTLEQQQAYTAFNIQNGISGRIVYFNHPGWMKNFKGEFVCVDGLQRITALIDFEENKFPVRVFNTVKQKFYRLYFKHLDGLYHHNVLKINVNNLPTRREVLKWYLELNSGGVIHSDEELKRVRKLLKQEGGIC